MNLTVRQATVNDIPILIQMRWDMCVEQKVADPDDTSLYQEYYDSFFKFLNDHLPRNECQIWMAFDQTIPVATVSLWLFPELPWAGGLHDWRGYVSNLYTLPMYRKQGVGSHLMQAIQQVALAYGVKELLLQTTVDSAGIYEKMGFTESALLKLVLA